MKNTSHLREIVLAIGIVLIVLRLFFPVKEYVIVEGVNRLNINYLKTLGNKPLDRFDKSVIVSKTIFQTIGIALLTGGFVLMYNEKEK